ncbi:hAT family C-terminal dimerization domain containing protein [Nitzschia inconspicua]|uniref:HAT family C-terminal dimerization domain containing protein n=1 Tax=Nitzschia inconspicua TaxID=303405 RepID=A0A9K3P7X8_9STRA|nr:hAT family C-terminal dimerization domain containing protein [Nitzschia inconspicua]KAG7347104.1 hAT family C-terminal dimerization domain containing protein [Nitzschia inconspicua]
MEQTFLGTVQRGARDRQVGVHPAFSIASFLDPRSKNMVPDLGAVYERVRAILIEQETKKRQSQGHAAGGIDAAAVTSTSNKDILDWGKEDDFFAELEADQAMGEQEAEIAVDVGVGGNTVESIVEDELKRYKSFSPMPYRKLLPSENKVSNDPLKWWEEKAAYLPIMSGLAKAYLSIQATSAPSERVFRRNRLNPELAGKMLFLAENWDLHKKHLLEMLLTAV